MPEPDDVFEEFPSSFKRHIIYPCYPPQTPHPIVWAFRKLVAIMDPKRDEKGPTQGDAQEVETVSPSNEVSSGEKLSTPDVYEESYVHHTVGSLQ